MMVFYEINKEIALMLIVEVTTHPPPIKSLTFSKPRQYGQSTFDAHLFLHDY